MKNTICALVITAMFMSSSHALLIAHYTFDTESTGTTPDSVGSGNFATLGNQVQINTSVTGSIGGGALEMLGGGFTQGPGDGATTSNSFDWTDDARTITFWWRAASPNVDARDGAFVSFGTEPGQGNRFDVKEQDASNTLLRVEVQGTGQNSNPTDFDDGNWQFVAVTVPDNATFADISWYVNGDSTNLNTSTNDLDIATGTSPITFGDSIVSTVTSASATNDRVPTGYLDDFQLYSRVLSQSEIQSLFNNPGDVIPDPGGVDPLGDFNDDGMVDLADYTVWRNNLGEDRSVLPAGSTSSDTGMIDSTDYQTWRDNFGADYSPLGGILATTVPEPSSTFLLGSLLALGMLRIRRISK